MNKVLLTRQRKVRRVWMRQLLILLSVIGPGLITANVDNDATGIATGTCVHCGFVKTGSRNVARGCQADTPISAKEPTKPPITESTARMIMGTVIMAGAS